MCCHSRRGNRGPAIVILGKMAYDKYQEHKAEKRAIASGSSPDSNYRRISQENLPGIANGEILEKTGMNPPSYSELVAQRAIVPATEPQVYVDGKEVKASEHEDDGNDLSDAESLYGVSDGLRGPGAGVQPGQGNVAMTRREQKKAACRAKCQQKKAARAARRAERNAM